MSRRPAPRSRRDVLRALGVGAAALPIAGCGLLAPARPVDIPATVRESPRTLPPELRAAPPPDPVSEPVAAADSSAAEPVAAVRSLVLPRRLRPGATVGLIAPAGVLRSADQLEASAQAVRDLGFAPKIGRHALARFGFLAGTDRERAADLMTMVTDDSVDAILCVRGGWGCARILPLLDYDAIRANPKPIIGYSDVTALLLAIYARAGLVTFHGPVGISTWPGTTARAFLDVLGGGRTLSLEGETRDRRIAGETVRGGIAEGPFAGGNLSVIAALAGTGYLPDLDGHVVFLEEVGEESYRLDRLFTQLQQAGILRNPAAVVFGQCKQCSDGGSSWTAEEVLRDHLGGYQCPAWIGAPIGHVSPVYTLPIGVPVRTDADAGTLEMLGPAVA